MLTIPNKSNGTQTLVVGNHLVFNYTADPSCEEVFYNAYLHMNEYISCIDMGESATQDSQHLQDIKNAMDLSPDKWGFYENWEQTLIDTNHHYRVVESCMRQYQATDYLINKYVQDQSVDIQELFYFLNRIESSYDSFVRIKEQSGAKEAIKCLEDDLRYGLPEGEKGYAPKDACIGIELMRRRLAVGGERVKFDDIHKVLFKIKDRKVREIKEEKAGKYRGIGRIGFFINQQPFRGDLIISYEDVVYYLQKN